MQRILNQFDYCSSHAKNCLPFLKISNFNVPQVIELTFYRKDCHQGLKESFYPSSG